MKKKLFNFVQTNKNLVADKMNVPKIICYHMLGENHSEMHHMVTGVVVIAFGVTIAESGQLINSGIVHFFSNSIGYLIHAAGSIPFLKRMEVLWTK